MARRGLSQLGRSVPPALDRLGDGTAEGARGPMCEGHEPLARSARVCAGHPGQAHARREAQDVCIRAARCARAGAAGRTLACYAGKVDAPWACRRVAGVEPSRQLGSACRASPVGARCAAGQWRGGQGEERAVCGGRPLEGSEFAHLSPGRRFRRPSRAARPRHVVAEPSTRPQLWRVGLNIV